MAVLQITYEELRRAIGFFAGYGRTTWDTTQTTDIDDSMFSGLRSFYWPGIDAKTGTAHRWSFLDVDQVLNLVSGTHTYLLPENYSRLKEYFTYPAGVDKRPIGEVPMQHLRAMRSNDSVTGDPIYCSIQARENVEGGRTIHEVSFHPTPDTARALDYRYEVEPFVPVENYDDTVPLGGAKHAETILEACLAAVERKLNPEAGPGYHAQQFMRLLAASIELDKSEQADQEEAWPLDSLTGGVSSLEVTKSQLQRLIGRAMGLTPNPKTWTHGPASSVAEILRTGLRKFYQPMVLPGERDSHQWSFLTPTHLIDLIPDQYEYDLPEDFAIVRGLISYAPESSVAAPHISLVTEEQVRMMLQTSSTSSRPYMAAVRVKHSNENTGTRYELLLAPIPSEARQIAIPYSINPEQLGTDQALPLGGQPHAQTVVEACLASAEITMNSGNVHQREFMTCLQTSVSFDRMLSSPQTMGYNADHSDLQYEPTYASSRFSGGHAYTTYNGESYWE